MFHMELQTWKASYLSINRARIYKRFRSPRTDSEESIPPGWESIPGELLKCLQIRAQENIIRKFRKHIRGGRGGGGYRTKQSVFK